MSVNVPPEVSLVAVRDYLVEREAQWEYADPTYEELHPNEDLPRDQVEREIAAEPASVRVKVRSLKKIKDAAL